MTEPAVWFPAIRAGTGTDVFTARLVEGLRRRGLRAEIAWLPQRAEYAPWSVPRPQAPAWANIAHVNTWLPASLLPRHLPVVATIHHAVHHPDAQAYKGWLRSAYHRYWIAPNERRVLRRAIRRVAVSRFVAETARQTLSDSPFEVIYNGIDVGFFQPADTRRSGRPFTLGYLGKWTTRKGVDLLAPIMRALGEGYQLLYTGGARRERRTLPANMHDVGRLAGPAAVRTFLQGLDALLFPSRSEGLPLSVLESLACGVPVIAARTGPLPEIVEDGITGLLCPPDEVMAFAQAARWLAAHPEHSQRMREAARARALAFDIEAMLERYLALYREVLGGERSADARQGLERSV